MNQRAYVSIGSNIEPRAVYIRESLRQLGQHENIQLEETSSIYETDPVGKTDQALFLNAVVQFITSLSPVELLNVTQGIEADLGRTRVERWGPRTVDLDILMYNNESINLQHLEIPHPRMLERSFVLVPLLEVQPDIRWYDGRKLKEVVSEIDKEGVRKWKKRSGVGEYGLFEN
ncbi:2-amino-4-hydroxy-6-hydroxymethyldihydropteridine diphosphokinase [Texcoconibacillus texcoconensis]|uniref:2-amino-4-hydroxy-6- hydroxymethyldihydropteridine diphosphokinase n=1 Tax=Texcoconibacillus texcoconensis TaxID=1095777 RepID=UPI0016083C7E|nr:2-amino-4-hydroxy-6-hydroxymethyldihydropteridine diphosphokinase [Texcoconibacillus texcoconensis]